MENNSYGGGGMSSRPITSFLSYLVGVPRKYLNEEDAVEAGNTQRVRAVRRLNQLRTQILRNFTDVNNEYKRGHYFDTIKSTASPFSRLCEEGITLQRQSSLSQEVIQINNWIYGYADEALEPIKRYGINMEWLKDLLIMPSGNTVEGVRVALKKYSSNRNFYPYQMFINWEFNLSSDEQKALNLFRSDDSFIAELNARYTPALRNDEAKEFVRAANRLVLIVDCENSDPAKLFGMVSDADKIAKIVLVNDENASEFWLDFEHLAREKNIEVETVRTNRLNANKSVVDLVVTQKCCAEYYENNTDSIVLASSDSDYLSIMSTLSNVRFAVTFERSKTSSTYIEKLKEAGVQIWSLDGYTTSESPVIIAAANRLGRLFSSITVKLDDVVNQVAERLHLWSNIDLLHDLKKQWIESAVLVKDTENGTISIAIRDNGGNDNEDDAESDIDDDEEDGDDTDSVEDTEEDNEEQVGENATVTPAKPVVRKGKKQKKAKKAKKKKKKK